MPAWFTLLFLAATTYTMAGIAREQVCIYMCPYARFQGSMFDEDSLIIAYHPEFGEPREANRRKRSAYKGEDGQCIDCNACVTVCPTGIDIRNGQQYECITCGACIDACDSVKERVKFKDRLVRYTSMREIQGGKTRWLRPRILIYGTLLIVFLSGIAAYFVFQPPVELNVIRHRQPIYIMQSDGSIQNNYTIRILNMSLKPTTFSLEVDGLADAQLSVAAIDKYDQQNQPLLTVPPGDAMPFTIYLKQKKASLEPGSEDITFTIRSIDRPEDSDSNDSRFMRP
jgi:cytochrome c oxidase accessory protein FixG